MGIDGGNTRAGRIHHFETIAAAAGNPPFTIRTESTLAIAAKAP
jgi:hypothetical protein